MPSQKFKKSGKTMFFQKQLELKENLGTLFSLFFQKQLELQKDLGMFTATLFSLL